MVYRLDSKLIPSLRLTLICNYRPNEKNSEEIDSFPIGLRSDLL